MKNGSCYPWTVNNTNNKREARQSVGDTRAVVQHGKVTGDQWIKTRESIQNTI